MDTIWLLFYVVFILNMLVSVVAIIYSALYDLRTPLNKEMSHYYPSITILIPAYNEEVVIERSLQAAISLNYPALSVVVVNDASKDSTAVRIEKFLKIHDSTSKRIKFINLRKNRGKGGALNVALKQVTSDLTMVLDADCIIDSRSLHRVISYFRNKQVAGVAMHVCLRGTWSLLGILQRIEFIVGHRHKKYYSAANAEFTVSGQGSTYRSSILRSLDGFHEGMMTEDIEIALRIAGKGNKNHLLVYAADALLYTEPVPTLRDLYKQRYRWKFGTLQALYEHSQLIFNKDKRFSRLFTSVRLPHAVASEVLLFLEPLFLILFIASAVSQQNLYVFLGIWISQALYNCMVILMDEQESRKERFILIVYASFLVPLFYLVTLMNVRIVYDCLCKWRMWTGKIALQGKWNPPTRPGSF